MHFLFVLKAFFPSSCHSVLHTPKAAKSYAENVIQSCHRQNRRKSGASKNHRVYITVACKSLPRFTELEMLVAPLNKQNTLTPVSHTGKILFQFVRTYLTMV